MFTATAPERAPRSLQLFLFAALLSAGCQQGTPPEADLGGGAGGPADYLSVWGTGPDDVYVVGSGGTLLHGHDGAFSPISGIPNVTYRGVSGGQDLVIVVGDRGTLLRSINSGRIWEVARLGITANLRAVSVLGRIVWAAGDGGTLLFSTNAGESFHQVRIPTTLGLHGVSVFSNGDGAEVYAVGEAGIIVHADGTTGKNAVAALVSGHSIEAVWASAPSSAYAVLDNHCIECQLETVIQATDVLSWKPVLGRAGLALHGIHGTGGDDVYAVGDFVVHKSGRDWNESTAGGRTLRGVWAYGRDVYMVGDGATILHNPPP